MSADAAVLWITIFVAGFALAVETNVVWRQAGQGLTAAPSQKGHAAGLVVPATPKAAPQGVSKALKMDGEQSATTDPSPAVAAPKAEQGDGSQPRNRGRVGVLLPASTKPAVPVSAAVFQSKHSTAELINRARCPMDADYTMSQSIYEANGWPLWRVTCARRKP